LEDYGTDDVTGFKKMSIASDPKTVWIRYVETRWGLGSDEDVT